MIYIYTHTVYNSSDTIERRKVNKVGNLQNNINYTSKRHEYGSRTTLSVLKFLTSLGNLFINQIPLFYVIY